MLVGRTGGRVLKFDKAMGIVTIVVFVGIHQCRQINILTRKELEESCFPTFLHYDFKVATVNIQPPSSLQHSHAPPHLILFMSAKVWFMSAKVWFMSAIIWFMSAIMSAK